MDKIKMRKTYHLNLEWKFHLGDEPRAWQKGFDDKAWRTVNLPHDWSVEQPFDKKHSSGTGYLPGGIGFYRKQFFLPKELEGKRVYVTFDGVYNNSMVWCNSYYLGKRPSGYTQFIYDLTDFACFGDEPNIITVKVDHKDIADSRWFTGSGIYRKVTLTVTDHIYIDHYGVFVSVEKTDQKSAILSIQTSVRNRTGESAQIIIRNSVYNAEYELVATAEESVVVQGDEVVTGSQKIKVNEPNLWSVNTPYLYTCKTEIEKEGMVIDEKQTMTGIRTFAFDAKKGFFLNGENMKLKGVCVHHDAGCLGAAVRKKVWRRRLESLKKVGCNAIRMSHNPHMPELYDLCDELGFLVIDEAFDEWEGVKNKWAQGHNVYPPAHYGYYEDFPDWHERDLSTMVLRGRNHPSIILWSIGNEVDYPNDPYCHPNFKTTTGNNDANKPAAERQYDPNKPNAERLVTIAKKLVSIVKKHDQTRPVTAALAFPELSNLTGYADCLDVVGYNYKEHLYEEDHKRYPDRILLGSENGKELEQWLAVKDKEYISAQFLWTGIDFLGETQGWPSHGSEAGILDIAGFEKVSYYFRQSLWSDKPMIKLFASYDEPRSKYYLYNKNLVSSWNFMQDEDVYVTCLTNCKKVELFLNDRSLGSQYLKDDSRSYLIWKVPFEKGELKAIAIDEKGQKYEEFLNTGGAPAGLQMYCTDPQITADGLDMAHVIVEIVDGSGQLVSRAEDLIYVSIEGPGQILGLENGNLEDNTPYALRCRRAYNGKLLIYIGSTPESGEIKVKAQARGLKSAEVIISSI